jgi:SAM-dependent methyltransferase
MRIDWLNGDTRVLVCPVCRSAGPKPGLLSAGLPGSDRRLTLVECPTCGAGVYDDFPSAVVHAPAVASALQFYVEQGAGIDVMLGPLFRFPRERVRRYLEVGCGFGYALDFVGRVFGWQGRGVDPSPLARAGREMLGVDIATEPLSRSSRPGEPFDLVFCSEVIEHVADPHEFVDVLSAQLASDGALAFTTPNMALIRRSASERPASPSSALLSALSPGHHLVLFDAAALERLLRAHGFTEVQVWEQPHTVHAVAARHSYPIRSEATVDRSLYRRYLAERAAVTPVETPLGLGFAYRLFKECVGAGDYSQAGAVFERLGTGCRRAYGLDLARPEVILIEAERPRDLDALARTCPFNLTGLLFFRGIIELNQARAAARALEYFWAAKRAGILIRTILRGIGADDGETEELVGLAHLQTLTALADLDPPRAVAELVAADVAARSGDDGGGPPAADRTRALFEAFVRLVNRGRYVEAAEVAEAVAGALEVTGQDFDTARPLATGGLSLNALFCLGILTLNHLADARRAFRLFALVRDVAGRMVATGALEPEAATLIGRARYWEALALQQAGDPEASVATVQSLLHPTEIGPLAVSAELRATALFEIFVRLVNGGQYRDAEKLAEEVTRALGSPGDDVGSPRRLPPGDSALNALYCLGILMLNHRAQAGPAARVFALVHDRARTAYAAGKPSPSATALIWQARYSQALALKQAGEHDACAVAVESMIRKSETRLPPVPAALCDSARELLA